MPQVIVVEHPRYSQVYRYPGTEWSCDDRHTLNEGEAWAEWVDRAADGVETPDYIAERSNDRERPLARQGNRVTHCVIPLPPHWNGRVQNMYRPGVPHIQGLSAEELQAGLGDYRYRISEAIAGASIATYERAARWSRPHGVVSILVGHGTSFFGQGGQPGYAQVDIGPGNSLAINTYFLRGLEGEVRRRRQTGQSFVQIASASDWAPSARTVLRMGVAFRGAQVRRVDLLVCQTGIGLQGLTFLNLLARFWGTQVRGMRGSAGYGAGGVWDVIRPIRRPETFSMRPQVTPPSMPGEGGVMASNDPAYRGTSIFMQGDIPGYPPDAMFNSSTNPGRSL
ncbi:MAG: hypothetical protein KC619_06205 [Myxococcales bacterium]|nr:hypothetical protein [Myxococcales bacterium]